MLYDDDKKTILQLTSYRHRPYKVYEKFNYIVKWDDYDFRIKFRLSKVIVDQVESVQYKW